FERKEKLSFIEILPLALSSFLVLCKSSKEGSFNTFLFIHRKIPITVKPQEIIMMVNTFKEFSQLSVIAVNALTSFFGNKPATCPAKMAAQLAPMQKML